LRSLAGELAGGGELTYSAGGASFKSPVIGLTILAMSFAFFMVFVIYVYTIKEGVDTNEFAN
jgi:hypothetical protein